MPETGRKLNVRVGADTTGFDQGMRRVGRNAERTGQKISRSASNYARIASRGIIRHAKRASFAIMGIGIAAAVVGAKFEDELMKTATVAQAFGKDLDALTDKARELGRTTAFTAGQAAEGMYSLASAGLKTNEILAATEHSMKLAGATGAQMSQATNLVASSLKQFNLHATASKRIVDTYAAAITGSLLTMDKLTEAMKFAGTTGAAFGWSIEETTAAVAQFVDMGLEGSMAGTNLRMSMLALTSPTRGATEALKRYNLTLEDVSPATHNFGEILEAMGGKAMTAGDAAEIFGRRAGLNIKQLTVLMETGSTNFDKFTQNLRDAQSGVGRATEMYNRMMGTFLNQFKIVISALSDLGIEIFGTFEEIGKKIFKVITESLNAISKIIKENQGLIGEDIKAFGDWLDKARKEGRFTKWARDMAIATLTAFKDIATAIYWVQKPLRAFEGIWHALKVAFAAFQQFIILGYDELFKAIVFIMGKIPDILMTPKLAKVEADFKRTSEAFKIYTTAAKEVTQDNLNALVAFTDEYQDQQDLFEATIQARIKRLNVYSQTIKQIDLTPPGPKRPQEAFGPDIFGQLVESRLQGPKKPDPGLLIKMQREQKKRALDLTRVQLEMRDRLATSYEEKERVRRAQALNDIEIYYFDLEDKLKEYGMIKEEREREIATKSIAIEKVAADARKAIRQQEFKYAIEIMSQLSAAAETLYTASGSRSKKWFNFVKGMRMAQATIDAYATYARIMAEEAVPIYIRYALATAAMAATLAKVYAISKQKPPAMAAGGVVPATPGGQLTQIAEGGKSEAVVPLPDGRSIPVDLRGSSGGGGVVPIVRNIKSTRNTTNIISMPGRSGGRSQQVVNHNYNLQGSTFLDQATLKRALGAIAIAAVKRNYDDDGSMRSMVRGGI